MRALPFGEEVGIGHQHPLPFEPLERQDHLARASLLAVSHQRLHRGNALPIDGGTHIGFRAGDICQPFADGGRQIKAQRHIVALHQRPRVHGDQRHQNALTVGNDLLFAAHIPVDRAKHQHRARQHPGQLHLVAARLWLRSLRHRIFSSALAQHPQACQKHGTQYGHANTFDGQRPVQLVIKLTQHHQAQQCAQQSNAPAPSQQGGSGNQGNGSQIHTKPCAHGQQSPHQHQQCRHAGMQQAPAAPGADQQRRSQQHLCRRQPARGDNNPVPAFFPAFAPAHLPLHIQPVIAIAALGDKQQHPDDRGIGKHRPASLRPPLPRPGQPGGFGPQPQPPQGHQQQTIELQRRQPRQPALQHHEENKDGYRPGHTHDGLNPARRGQPGPQHLQGSQQHTSHQQVGAGIQVIDTQIDQHQRLAQQPQHQPCAARKSLRPAAQQGPATGQCQQAQ